MQSSKMAARSDAAAAPGPKDGAFMSLNVVCSSPNSVNLPLTHKEKHIYDRRSLLDIGNAYKHQLSQAATEKLRGLCLLLEPDLETAASPTDATRTRQRHNRTHLFGTMITGLLLMGLGFALGYRRIQKTGTAVQSLTRLPVMIEAVGRAVSIETETINRNMDSIMEKLTALQRKIDGDQNGQKE